MKRSVARIVPFLLAATLPALAVFGFFTFLGARSKELWEIGVLALFFASLYVLVLGVPGILFMRHKKWLRWWSVLVLGLLAGAIPLAAVLWPRSEVVGVSRSTNGVWTMLHGVPTIAGWELFARDVAFYAGCGAIGAIGYLIGASLMRSNQRLERP